MDSGKRLRATSNQPGQDRDISRPYFSMSNIYRLPDGRDLGYVRFGNEDGPQVFYLHGLPGSRLEGKGFYGKHLAKFGAGMISVERPGLGLSTPQPGRTLSDHAQDVLQLAKHLGLEEWWVIGVSGGGPYALACARHHPPENLRGVAICAGLGPYEFGLHGMGLGTKSMLLCFRFAPWILHLVYRPIVWLQSFLSDEKQVDMMQKNMQKPNSLLQIQEKDIEIFKDRDLLMTVTASSREHFRQGFGGYVEDGRCMCEDWDFRIEDIDFRPIQLWHGKYDVNCPKHMAEKIAGALGEGVELNIVDETHVSASVNCAPVILEHLLRNATTGIVE